MDKRQIKSVQKDWERISNGNVEVEMVGNGLYGFCTELESLRLLKHYRHNRSARQGYSENLKTFFFVLDIEN